MQKVLIAFIISLFSLSSIAVSNAEAVGLGFYLQKGAGSGESTTYDVVAWGNDVEDDFDYDQFSIGFQMDTAPLDDKIFNYRLNIGLGDVAGDSDLGNDFELKELKIENDFGFRVAGNNKFRIWLGPELAIGFYEGDNDYGGDLNMMSLGLGPVVGANIGITDSMAVTVKVGYIFSAFVGLEEVPGDEYDIDGTATTLYISAGMLFMP